MNINRERDALIIVDMQRDFINGSLRVPNASEIIKPILEFAEQFDVIVATQDWHPANHSSFKDNGGPWPTHCVQGTLGAELHPMIAAYNRIGLISRKGMDVKRDSYSAFRDNSGPASGLTGYLLNRGIHRPFFVGLAREYCVLWSARDAVGFDPYFVWDLTRPVDPASDEKTRADLHGVEIV